MALIRRVTDEKDTAMRRADDRLADTEKRISDIYSQAAVELTENFNTFMDRYEAKDAEYRQRVLDGEMPEDEYIRWRTNSILRGREMQKQIDNLSIGLTRTDELAVAAIRGDMPYIYTDAYNFGGYRGEMLAQAAGYDYSQFAIYNTDAIRIIAADDPDLIPWDDPELDEDKDLRWNRRHIQNAIAQGILQGDSIPNIANRLLPIVNMDENAARRTARTAYTSVQNQGRRDATARVKAAGIPMVEPWMSVLASNTRDTHLLLHGTYPNEQGKYGAGIIPTGNLLRWPADPLGDPEQIYNCQCRVQSYIEGIDHSHDDELYAMFMQENYYDDWLEVKDYKAADRAVALERQRQLLNGEVENREAVAYRNRMARQGVDVTASASTGNSYRNLDGIVIADFPDIGEEMKTAIFTEIDDILGDFPKAKAYLKEIENIDDDDDLMGDYANYNPFGYLRINEFMFSGDISEINQDYDDLVRYHLSAGLRPVNLISHEMGHVLERAYMTEVGRGWTQSGWKRNTYAASIFDHVRGEMGISVDEQNAMISQLSNYATENLGEALAECICNYRAYGANANPLSIAVYNFLRKKLR